MQQIGDLLDQPRVHQQPSLRGEQPGECGGGFHAGVLD